MPDQDAKLPLADGSMHAIVIGKPHDPLRRVLGVLHDWNATAASP